VEERPHLDKVPVITILDRTVTGREDVSVPAKNGFYVPPDDLLAVSLTTRDGRKTAKGFVKGFGRGLGGLASTVAHDTHGLLVLGSRPEDMALAAKDALLTGGGVTLAHGGEVLARIPLPMGGICSLERMPVVAEGIRELNRRVQALGSHLDNPLWTLVFLSFTSVLLLRLTYEGVYDVREGRIVF